MIRKNYWLFLLVVVFFSYGQVLFMQPWQDDNAVMFKLAHIDDRAGYLGKGILGEGAYKYTAFFYYPLYLIFGYNSYAFFGLAFVTYFLSTLSVFFVSKKILGEEAGRLAGFLYAAGYMASDGYLRLYNSVITSLSVVLISFLLLFLWKFWKEGRHKYYLLSLSFFLLSVEFARARAHYLIAIPVIFELLFSAFKKPFLRSFFHSIVRILPFGYIFFKYFVEYPDERSKQLLAYLLSIVSGNFDSLRGFWGSFSNLVIPDWAGLAGGVVLVVIIFLLYLIVKSGGEVRRLSSFFLLWALINIFAYSAYNPLETYSSDNRYLAHSFFAFVLFLSTAFRKRIVVFLVVVWGIGNLTNSILLQDRILKGRSLPVKKFFSELKALMPVVNKGDIIYFDVADDAKSIFADAFSVAQMPEETALAWRYGLDRYDFRMSLNQEDLGKANKSFFFSKKALVDINEKLLKTKDDRRIFTFDGLTSQKEVSRSDSGTFIKKIEMEIPIQELVESVSPLNLKVTLSASPIPTAALSFPFVYGKLTDSGGRSFSEISEIYRYKDGKANSRKNIKVEPSSTWSKDIAQNMFDSDMSTFWQSDRLVWKQDKANLLIDVLPNLEYQALVLINASANRLPLVEKIYQRRNKGARQEIFFEKKVRNFLNSQLVIYNLDGVKTGGLEIDFIKTLGDDSPMLSEIWLGPPMGNDFDVFEAESFLVFPFSLVESKFIYNFLLDQTRMTGEAQIFWQGDKYIGWKSTESAKFNLNYDGRVREYEIKIPAGGTQINKLKIVLNEIPGEISFYSLIARHEKQN